MCIGTGGPVRAEWRKAGAAHPVSGSAPLSQAADSIYQPADSRQTNERSLCHEKKSFAADKPENKSLRYFYFKKIASSSKVFVVKLRQKSSIVLIDVPTDAEPSDEIVNFES